MSGYDKLSLSQKHLIDKYEQYLENTPLKPATRLAYKSKILVFMLKNNLENEEDIKVYLREHGTPSNSGFKWLFTMLNISLDAYKTKPKGTKHKNHPRQKRSLRTRLGFTYESCNDEYVQRFQKERNLMPSTMHGHWNALNIYIPLCGFKNAKEMIEEAYEDERKGLPPKKARIKQHLSKYLLTLRDNLDNPNTIHTYFTKLETFYRHYDVSVPNRPPMQMKNKVHVSYEDLPTKDMIRKAVEQSELDMKALILFMSSSGTAMAETINMRVKDLVKGLKYHTSKTDINMIIDELQGRRDIVPCIPMLRIKTDVPYYTCCSPEASYYLFEYLNVRRGYYNLKDDDKVFDMAKSMVMKKFTKINDENEWGKVANYRRFRSHALRKYHASNIGCSFDVINMLEGRSNGTIHQTYVKTQPEKLRETYMKYMKNVMIKPEEFGYASQLDRMKDYVDEKLQENTSIHGEFVPQIPQQNNCLGNTKTQQNNSDLLIQLQELTKQVGILEYRIRQLENKGG